jgi:hypothetical protein
VIDAMTNGLPDGDVGTGNYAERLSQLLGNRGAIHPGLQRRIDLGCIHALSMLIQLGTALPAVGSSNAVILQQYAFYATANRV